MLIVLEGADGCGKTTIAHAMGKTLGADVLHFPDDDAVTGPLIRSYLKKQWGVYLDNAIANSPEEKAAGALVFQALQIANRMEHMQELLDCAGSKEFHLVLARYWQSAMVYGVIDDLDPEFIEETHEAMAKADLNILLDVEPETVAERRAKRMIETENKAERYEATDLDKRVIDLYRELWEESQYDGVQKSPRHDH